MANYRFPGFPAFLEVAAEELDRPDAIGPARRIAPLAALASLCAQAAEADPAHVPAILAEAATFRDQLRVAARAAELILDDLHAGRAPAPTEAETAAPDTALELDAGPEPEAISPRSPASGRGIKKPTGPRTR